MNTKAKAIALLLGASAALSTYGQNIPLTAKVHQTEQVFINGQLVRTHTREGIFLRTSTGMVLRQWTLIDGKQPTGESGYGVVTDTQKGVIFSLDYARQTAYQRPTLKIPQNQKPQPSNQAREGNSQEKGSFQGISCSYKPSYLHTKSGENVSNGRTCRSDTYGIDLDIEVTFPAPSNPAQYSKVSEQLTDIQIGSEPDSKLFDFHNFTIYRPDEKN